MSYYVKETKNETYVSHENTMLKAAESFTIETLNGKTNISLPGEGDSINVYLSELEDNEFIKKLNAPDGGTCDSDLSFVKITNNAFTIYFVVKNI